VGEWQVIALRVLPRLGVGEEVRANGYPFDMGVDDPVARLDVVGLPAADRAPPRSPVGTISNRVVPGVDLPAVPAARPRPRNRP
jgi:hypothetical protein